VEISLGEVTVNWEIFDHFSQCSSKLQVSCAEIEILDNIPTSVWRKFLTKRKDAKLETNEPVLRVLLDKVRPYTDLEHHELRFQVRGLLF
jgi:hypothetical protein